MSNIVQRLSGRIKYPASIILPPRKVKGAKKKEPPLPTVLDIVINQTHEFRGDATDFPIETGSTISDNISTSPPTISFTAAFAEYPSEEAYLTNLLAGGLNLPFEKLGINTPLGSVGSVGALITNVVRRDKDNLREVTDAVTGEKKLVLKDVLNYYFVLLQKTFYNRTVFTMDFSFVKYENCVFTNLGITRQVEHGNNLFFSASVKQLNIVRIKSTRREFPDEKKEDKGDQSLKETTSTEEEKTVINSILLSARNVGRRLKRIFSKGSNVTRAGF